MQQRWFFKNLLGQVEGGCMKIHLGLVPWESAYHSWSQFEIGGGRPNVIHHIQCQFIYFGWVGYKVTDGACFFIVWIRFDPLILRREPNSNFAIDKCLNYGCRHGKLVWHKQFTVASQRYTRCVWTCLNSHLDVQAGVAALTQNLYGGWESL